MSTLEAAIAVGLISFAIAQNVSKREGSFGIFEKLRDYWKVKEGNETYVDPEDGYASSRPKSAIARLLSCPYCTGFWAILLVTLAFSYDIKSFLVVGGMAWGIQTILQNVADIGEK